MQIPEKIQEKYNNKAMAIAKAKVNKAMAIEDNIKITLRAEELITTLNGDMKWLPYYCKVVINLSEYQVNKILGLALKADDPSHFFASVSKAEMVIKGLRKG